METGYHQCPSCSTNNRSVLEESFALVCKQCAELIYVKTDLGEKRTKVSTPPPDWSFIQVGTEGGYNENTFTVVGRVRLQLTNDYKNFWCAALKNGKYIWLMESFASFAILGAEYVPYGGTVKKLHAGERISLGDLKLTGEYVEKCEGLSFEGELGEWNHFRADFFFIQCSNNAGNTAVFLSKVKEKGMEYLRGGKVDIEKLKLKNTLAWNEWK